MYSTYSNPEELRSFTGLKVEPAMKNGTPEEPVVVSFLSDGKVEKQAFHSSLETESLRETCAEVSPNSCMPIVVKDSLAAKVEENFSIFESEVDSLCL